MKSIRIALIAFACVAIGAVALCFYVQDRDEEPMPIAHEDTVLIQTRPTTSVLFVGDMMLGRYVQTLSKESGEDYPFKKIEGLLRASEYVVANLEGPIVASAPQTPIDGFQFAFPSYVASLIARFNIAVVSLGNNHGVDYGDAGWNETLSRLQGADVIAIGHPVRIATTSTAVVADPNGRQIRYISFNATFPSFVPSAAHAFVRKETQDDIFTVVLIHWGNEYQLTSSVYQKELAHALIDEGADAVIGHHPHVTEEIEIYKDGAIFYSLGNFIFDQYFSKDVEQGLAVRFLQGDTSIRYELIPLRSSRSQPEEMSASQRDLFLGELADRTSSSTAAFVRQGFFDLPLPR